MPVSSKFCKNLFFYKKKLFLILQLWCPLTPPINESDVFIDNEVISSLYETTPIPEAQLPPVHYVKKGEKRLKSDSISSNSSPSSSIIFFKQIFQLIITFFIF